jgi:two-component system, chemotaxis family, sensor kinase CheA
MDAADYLPLFLAESREHLQELSLAVLRIEEAPDDRETRDEIFRIAHSLKGMSATMGFERMAALTHKMEDVFELLRQRQGGLEREAIDVVLACLDALGAAVDSIEADGSEQLDERALVARLQGLVHERTPEQELERAGGATDPGALAARAHGRRVLHLRVELEAEVDMPAVRAYMVLEAARSYGELLGSSPTDEHVDAFTGRAIEAWVAGDADPGAVQRALLAVSDVRNAAVEETSPSAAPGQVEQAAASVIHGQKTAGTVRVDAERLDQLMHLMGEVLVNRTAVESIASSVRVPGLHQALQELTRSSQALQAMVMQVRMIPVEAVFLRFPRLVRDLSTKLGKSVELVLSGKETELDRTVVDALGDPIVHLVRNALDHGLESPEERVAAGKPATGTIEISARHAGGAVLIGVRDDGHGIDPARVARKAAERGLISPDAVDSVDMARAIELLFAPGFTTAEQTSDLSGRGVGMDAVREAVRGLGGEVVVQSETGAGTTATIRLPLTLAIMVALVVESRSMPFAIPLDRVERTLKLEPELVHSLAGHKVLSLPDGVLPLVDLSSALGHERGESCAHVVIVRTVDHRLALAVDRLEGQRELVTRPLPNHLEAFGLSGGAVLSDGAIALIVDCDAIGQRLTASSDLAA